MNTKHHVVFLRGKKTILRPIEESDVPLLTKWINDPEVRQFLTVNMPMMHLAEKKWVEGLVDRKGGIVLAVTLLDGTHIGMMGLHDINHIDGTATTGAFIGEKKYWGKGYGTDAKMQLLNYAFNTLNLRKICSRVIAFNGRSIAYSKHCGYVDDGVQKKHVFKDGEYHDIVQLALWKDAWLPYWKKHLARKKS